MQLEAFTAKVHTARLLVFWVVLYLDLCVSLSQRIKYTANCPPDIFTSVFYMGKMSRTSNTGDIKYQNVMRQEVLYKKCLFIQPVAHGLFQSSPLFLNRQTDCFHHLYYVANIKTSQLIVIHLPSSRPLSI